MLVKNKIFGVNNFCLQNHIMNKKQCIIKANYLKFTNSLNCVDVNFIDALNKNDFKYQKWFL